MNNLVYLSEIAINSFISLALMEDVGDGDHSSLASIPADAQNKAKLLVKDNGIIAGVNLAEKIFFKVDPLIQFHLSMKDGSQVKYGDIAFNVEGNARAILKAGIELYATHVCHCHKNKPDGKNDWSYQSQITRYPQNYAQLQNDGKMGCCHWRRL